jgi:hypothetical protein
MLIAAGILVSVVTGCSIFNHHVPLIGTNVGLKDFPGKNPTATKAYLNSLSFTQTDSVIDASIPCHDAADCAGGSVHLRVVPEMLAYTVPAKDALKSGRGYIVARIVNESAAAYGSFHLLPNDTAYLWVGATATGDRRVAIYNISKATGAATLRSVASQAGWCTMSPGMVRTKSAVHLNPMPECQSNSFYTTIGSIGTSEIRLASTSSSILGDATRRAIANSSMAHSSGLWFSCSIGCCEGSGFRSAF